jgi:hypothetical protein
MYQRIRYGLFLRPSISTPNHPIHSPISVHPLSTSKAPVLNMYVHIEVLDTRGSLASLGTDPRDQIVLRVGLPPSSRSKKPTPERIVRSPILYQPTGIAVPAELVSDLKREITKRTDKRRALDKYLARLQVTKDGKWVGTVYVRLVCLANGYVVDRWVSMKPAAGVEPGELQIRIVMRETEAAALAVLSQEPEQNVQPNEMTRTEGCDCDVCDPDHVNRPKYDPMDLAYGTAREIRECVIS